MIYCVFIGSFKDGRFKQLTEEFHQRLSRLWPVKVLELAEKEKEILKFIREKRGKVQLISLDPQGKPMDSASFGNWVTQSSKDIYFFAWGADGPCRSGHVCPQEIASRTPALTAVVVRHRIAGAYSK